MQHLLRAASTSKERAYLNRNGRNPQQRRTLQARIIKYTTTKNQGCHQADAPPGYRANVLYPLATAVGSRRRDCDPPATPLSRKSGRLGPKRGLEWATQAFVSERDDHIGGV